MHPAVMGMVLSIKSVLYLVKKGKKFMKGHGYSTLNGYKFNWTFDKDEARKMEYSTANNLAISSGGSVLHFA
jgi:hypothetical protein